MLISAFFSTCKKDEIKTVAVVETGTSSNVTSNTATIIGTITSTGNDKIIQCGHCWSSTSQEPTIDINEGKTTLGEKPQGNIQSELTNLKSERLYYIRAYTTNSQGISYGSVITIKTAILLTNGLVAYYSFNGNANDLSGNNNNGNIYGASLVSDRFGTINSSYSFSGSDNYIEILNNSTLNSTTGSWCFWFKMSTPSTGGGANDNPSLISRVDFPGSLNGICFFETSGKLNCGIKANSNESSSVQSTNIVTDNVYHFAVVTFVSGSYLKLYVDGALNSSSICRIFNFNNQPLRVGRSVDTYWKSYKGELDDVRIYHRVLTDNEILQLFNAK